MATPGKTVFLISNGDYRDAACEMCWPRQKETIDVVNKAFQSLGYKVIELPEYSEGLKHGFVTRQCYGTEIFSKIDPAAPVVILLNCWSYAHHVASGLQTHKGPILLLGNFDGTWPGLVALLNHSATLSRLCVEHTRLWSESFTEDHVFMDRLKAWCETGKVIYETSHLASADTLTISPEADSFGKELAAEIIKNKRILGQLDPGCMGMLNALINPAKLGAIGMPIELLNQSDLVAEMGTISDKEAQAHLNWIVEQGTWFDWGVDQFKDLVHSQVLEQMKMYSAAARYSHRFGLAAIGIPYQIGLVRCVAASDLAEGMLNNSARPDVVDPVSGKVIQQGKPIIHFNEGDIGSGVPQVIMNDIYQRKSMPPETTLHDIRWGREYDGKFVWVFEISGGAPPAHYGGWENARVYRQPSMYFPLGGGSCSGISKPGVITWARFYESFGEIGMDCGIGEVLPLDKGEVQDRLNRTTAEWPIANVHIPGYDRDQCMSSHMSNHITIGYGDILQELIATCIHLGIPTRVAGDVKDTLK